MRSNSKHSASNFLKWHRQTALPKTSSSLKCNEPASVPHKLGTPTGSIFRSAKRGCHSRRRLAILAERRRRQVTVLTAVMAMMPTIAKTTRKTMNKNLGDIFRARGHSAEAKEAPRWLPR